MKVTFHSNMFDLVVKRINSTYISAVDRRCYIKWREGKKWSRYTFSKRPGMSINYWTLEDAQNIQIARYIYFACSTVRFSSIDILKDCLNWLLGMDLGCHQLMFRWRGSIHRSPNNMDRYHLRVIQVITYVIRESLLNSKPLSGSSQAWQYTLSSPS